MTDSRGEDSSASILLGLYREGKIVDPLPGLVWTLGPGSSRASGQDELGCSSN